MPESAQHEKIKDLIATELRKLPEIASVEEYLSSGHRADVYAATLDGISILVEVVWSDSRAHFEEDLNGVHESDANVKLVIASLGILKRKEYRRRYERVVISERKSKRVKIHSEMVDGERIISEQGLLHDIVALISRYVEEVRREKGTAETLGRATDSVISTAADEGYYVNQLAGLETEPIVKKIESRGYWRVVIRPLRFEKERLKSPDECRRLIEASTIRLRGWPYPYDHPDRIHARVDGVQGEDDWCEHIGYWRMFQSGQFVHFFACEEDWWSDFGRMPDWIEGPKGAPFLHFVGVLCTLSEIYEFVAKLTEKKLFDEKLSLTVELHGMKNRRLASINRSRPLMCDFICLDDTLRDAPIFSVQEIRGGARELALKHSARIFEVFNWRSPNMGDLRKIQEDVLKRR